MKAMIIGAAGFVGPYLINEVKKDMMNCDIIATKLPNENFESNIAKVIDLNILDFKQVSEAVSKEKPDYIFHLAAQSSVALSWKKPQLTVDINIKGVINLLEAIRNLDNYNPRILIVGSSEEYGRQPAEAMPLSESVTVNPKNVYAISKLSQNMISKLYVDAYGMNIVLTRSFNHMGPGQLSQFVVSDFCKQVAEIEKGLKEPIMKVGNLSAKRDFTDVRDIVNAYVKLIQTGRSGETYNVGSGHSYAISDILDKIISLSSSNIKVETDKLKFRPIDVPLIVADIDKLKKDTGWNVRININKTLQDTLEYWRNLLRNQT